MDRRLRTCRRAFRRVPRACGDGPLQLPDNVTGYMCSPRMRGWTVLPAYHDLAARVFPAHAGMDRCRRCRC